LEVIISLDFYDRLQYLQIVSNQDYLE